MLIGNLEALLCYFEPALISAFAKVFPESRPIGCLFHLKQALYRGAQALGITTTEFKEETKNLINKLGSLSWKKDNSDIDREFKKIEQQYADSEYKGLVSYYKNE